MRALWPVLACAALAVSFSAAYGHGVGFEVLDPVRLGDREVALEISSSRYDPGNPEKEITFSLADVDTGVTVRDVTFEITGYKGDTFLFNGTFLAPDGIFVFALRPSDSEEVTLEKADRSGLFGSLLGLKEEIIYADSKLFGTGGLYKFDVRITTAESFSNQLDPPIEYKVGLSIPQKTFYEIDDPNFGTTEVSIITYYDEVTGFRYDPSINGVSFHMPFDWSAGNINETVAVHEEFAFPKTFGDLLFAEYSASVNGLSVPGRVITVDGFMENQTVVHVVLGQNDLFDLSKRQADDIEGMDLVLRAKEGSPQGTITANGQFQVTLDWEPKDIRSGQETVFHFRISDVFLRNTPVAVDYDVSLVRDGVVIYSGTGTSTDSQEQRNEFVVPIPENSSGPVTVRFENLADNRFARTAIPIIVDRVQPEVAIPEWVKTSAGWWAQGVIDDQTFVAGIEYLVRQEIIQVSGIQEAGGSSAAIPEWVKTSAGWWAQGVIDDQTFANGIKFLIEAGIIST